jgi:hypothetical protein
MSIPQFTLTANLQNLIGSGLGYLKITLINPNAFASPIKVSGTTLVDQLTYVTPVAASVSVTLWGLDVLSPSNCIYKVEAFNSGSTLAWVAYYNDFVGSGTQDLSTLTAMNQPNFPAPTFGTANANTFYAGPTSGGAGVPTMRSIVTADVQGVAVVDAPTASQTITGQPLTLASANLTLDSASNLTANGQNVLKSVSSLNSTTLYVGGGVTTWAGSDIGAQINAAYASLQADGGTIVVLPPSGGGSVYNYSTAIALSTSAKFVTLQGGGGSSAQVQLNFTPTTAPATTAASVTSNVATLTMASNPITFGFVGGETVVVSGFTGGDTYFNGTFQLTAVTSTQIFYALTHANASAATNGAVAPTALTLDYTPIGGTAEAPGGGVRDLTIVNNGSYVPTSTKANGVIFGGKNYGAHRGYFLDFRVGGFNQNYTVVQIQSWGMTFYNCGSIGGTIGWSDGGLGYENVSWFGGTFAGNTTHVVTSAGGDTYFYGVSFDQHVTAGITQSAGNVFCYGCHFENSAVLNTHWVNNTGTSNISIIGGWLLDDATSSNTDYYFQSAGYSISIEGLYLNTLGRTVTNVLSALSGVRGYVRFINQGLATSTTMVGGANAAFVTDLSMNVLSSNAARPTNLEAAITTPTATLTAAAPTTAAGQVSFGGTTAATASAGGGQAALATVAGYLIVNVAGTARKIPYFAT